MKVSNQDVYAFYLSLDRSLFMTSFQEMAGMDAALPIGYGQTVSQPSLVCKMTQLLELETGSRVLEIGTGSGYQTAYLARFSDQVYTVEIIPELYRQAVARMERLGYKNVYFRLGDGTQGWPEHAPYDRIIVTAAARKMPVKLIEQLKPGGIMVLPVGAGDVQALRVLRKNEEGDLEQDDVLQVRFVPLVGKYDEK